MKNWESVFVHKTSDMNLNSSIPYIDAVQLQYMKLIDLNNYYINGQERGIIICQICKLNIANKYVFEHTTSKRHKYNKLLFSIAQGHSCNVEVDFIVLHIDRLKCRYCDPTIINSDREDLTNHIQDIRHVTKRQYYFDQTSASSLLKPLDTLITYDNRTKKQTANNIATRNSSQESKPAIQQFRATAQEAAMNIKGTKNILPFSGAFKAEEVQSGIESTEFIRIGKNGDCICTLCLVKVPNNSHNIDMHVRGIKHKEALKIRPNFQDFILRYSCVKDSSRGCKICLVEFPNIYSYINKHIYGINHKNAMLRLIRSQNKNLENEYMNKSVPEIKAKSNIDERNIPQYSRFTRDYERERREESPKRFTIGENGPCFCPFCAISLANGIDFVGVHPNCTKNRRLTVPITKSRDWKSEAYSFAERDSPSYRYRYIYQDINTSRPEPRQSLKYRSTTNQIVTNFGKPNNMGQTSPRVQESEDLSFFFKVLLVCCLSYLWFHYYYSF